MQRNITVSGVTDDGCGFSRLFVDVKAEDGQLIDTYRMDSLALSFDELWVRYGRPAVRGFRQMYGI